MTLTSPAGPAWTQVTVTYDNHTSAEHVAVTVLGPLLDNAQKAQEITGWWFTRKSAAWRLRLGNPTTRFVDALIARLAQQPQASACAATTYEPEIVAFGGPESMTAAHTLFAVDSQLVLEHLAAAGDTHRRELPFILATRLMRAAGLEWHEQGDCWARLAGKRTADGAEPGPALIGSVEQLLLASQDTPGSPLAGRPAWTAAMEQAGHHLADLAATGTLTRGLRAVIATHLLFLFNRHGVSGHDQYLLAAAARHAVFDSPGENPATTTHTTPGPSSGPASLGAVTDTIRPADAAQLRNALADWIKGRATFRTLAVETAFRTVPRELFLPEVPLDVAYGRTPVVTRRDDDGTSLSSASAPNMVAAMLEQLTVHPGQSILEIGAATGVNAALLKELTGHGGNVVTIEYDQDFAASAAEHLAAAGYPDVTVIAGDGALGHPEKAPYDRIIVTAGAWDLSTQLWDQLSPNGRIVVPLRLHGSGLTRSLAFDRTGPGTLVAHGGVVCGFVAMRGATERDELRIPLADGVVFRVESSDHPDPAALADAFSQPLHEQWTGIATRYDDHPTSHLDLWLLTHTSTRFGRLAVTSDARTTGTGPARRWAGAALYTDNTISYLTTREIDDNTAELGVVTRGLQHSTLAGTAVDLLHQWDKTRPAQPTITAHRNPATVNTMPYLTRPNTTLTISW
jgi:protein-L-isoaspartate(D-aspartate) O-methyltransferase